MSNSFFAIKKGSKRTAIFIGPIVAKFTRDWRWVGRNREYVEAQRHRWWQGIISNVTEAATSGTFQHQFLARVYLTLGLISFQRRINGRKLDDGEIQRRIIRQLPAEADRMAQFDVDRHSTTGGDWIEDSSGKIYLVDYGDTYCNGRPMSEFIAHFGDAIDAACGHGPLPS